MTLVSFVMPVWSPRRDWLRAAVASVLGQRDCPLELVVVDDGCPEPVEPLLAGFDDSRLRVVRVEHGGESAARNAGVEAARGDRIRFVDADDIVEPGSTSRLAGLVGRRDDVVAYGATLFCDSELRPVWKLTCGIEGDARVDCLLQRFTVRHTSLLFPRAVVEAAGGWDPSYTVSQDWDFVLRALEHATVTRDAAVAARYRKHGSSATAAVDAGILGARRIVSGYFDRHPDARGTALERQAEAALEAVAARVYLSRGLRRRGLRAAGRALVLDPRALAREATQAAPALAGRARRR